MNRIGGIVILLLGLPAAKAGPQIPEQTATPAEQFRALRKESQSRYDAIQRESFKSVPKGGMLPDEQRTALAGRAYRIKYEQAPKLVELAEKHP